MLKCNKNYQPLRRDGCGDDERFRIVATALAERGWNAAEIKQEVAAQPWRFVIPLDWDDNRASVRNLVVRRRLCAEAGCKGGAAEDFG
jgi:hypothetical protein